MKIDYDVSQEIAEKLLRTCYDYPLRESIFAINMTVLSICSQTDDPESAYKAAKESLEILKNRFLPEE